jgi:KDO2-lipid IV(A) lauroyltransferase
VTRSSWWETHDARTGQRWSFLQALKNHLIFWTVRWLLWLADRLPDALLLAIGRGLGRAAHALLRRERAVTQKNLRAACPDADVQTLTRLTFRNAGENLTRTLLLRRARFGVRDHVHVSEHNRDLLASALAEGRGVVFVSAHLGPFEWLAAALAEHGFRPAIVVRESYDRRLSALVDQHRVQRGLTVIHRGAAGAELTILRALRAGRPVGFLPDLAGRVRTTRARWLGGTSPLAAGPGQLAARLGAPLLVGTLQPEPHGSGYSVRLERLPVTGAEDMTQSVASALERAILNCREEWLWMARPLGDS